MLPSTLLGAMAPLSFFRAVYKVVDDVEVDVDVYLPSPATGKEHPGYPIGTCRLRLSLSIC